MTLKPLIAFAASFSMLATTLPMAPAFAGGSSMSGYHSGGGMTAGCKNGGGSGHGGSGISIYKPVTINKNISVYKPVNINTNINIDKTINIYKPVTITKNIDNSKNITINKNVSINKSIVINKGGGSASAEASAWAAASAQASSSAQANVVNYGGSYMDYTVINKNVGGDVSVSAEQTCHMQDASVVKAIHAVCVADGREFGASHMIRDTWIDSSYEGEVARCIPGATLKVIIGDMVQSDQGMAGSYENGQVLACATGEAVRHYKDGMLKCAPAVPVKDCTERTNLRLYGTGDFFFSFRTQVCASSVHSAESSSDAAVSGMTLEGGVGGESSY
jgi:hypothetical protein